MIFFTRGYLEKIGGEIHLILNTELREKEMQNIVLTGIPMETTTKILESMIELIKMIRI